MEKNYYFFITIKKKAILGLLSTKVNRVKYLKSIQEKKEGFFRILLYIKSDCSIHLGKIIENHDIGKFRQCHEYKINELCIFIQ